MRKSSIHDWILSVEKSSAMTSSRTKLSWVECVITLFVHFLSSLPLTQSFCRKYRYYAARRPLPPINLDTTIKMWKDKTDIRRDSANSLSVHALDTTISCSKMQNLIDG